MSGTGMTGIVARRPGNDYNDEFDAGDDDDVDDDFNGGEDGDGK